MSKKEPGGYAFPTETEFQYYHGLTKRDYFAAKAMQGLLAADIQVINGLLEKTNGSGSVSELAYVIADAMLKAREQ